MCLRPLLARQFIMRRVFASKAALPRTLIDQLNDLGASHVLPPRQLALTKTVQSIPEAAPFRIDEIFRGQQTTKGGLET